MTCKELKKFLEGVPDDTYIVRMASTKLGDTVSNKPEDMFRDVAFGKWELAGYNEMDGLYIVVLLK